MPKPCQETFQVAFFKGSVIECLQKFKQCYYIEKEPVLDASLIVITSC
jgi:hypothetical protein